MARHRPGRVLDPSLRRMIAEEVLNDRLNVSEAALVREIGRSSVNALIADFKACAARDDQLWELVRSQPDPYRWLYDNPDAWSTRH